MYKRQELPNNGEIVFFDRSWYNRAIVEPVMGFCNDDEYNIFMNQVNDFEKMITEENIILIKFWFSITKQTQKQRFNVRLANPLKRWKFSIVDKEGQTQTVKPVVPTAFVTTHKCPAPICAAYLLGKSQRRTTETSVIKRKMDMKLKQNILIPGMMVSSDQFESAVRGRLPHTYGREKDEDRFCGGTIFCDHATTFI